MNSDPSFTPSISGKTIKATRDGIFHNLAYGTASAFDISNNTINAVASATETKFDGISLSSLSVGATVSGTDLLIASDAGAADTTFAGTLAACILDGTASIDARNATFVSVTPSDNTLSDLYAVEGKIGDGLDQAGGGLVRLRTANVYVAQSSETTHAGAVQRGVDRHGDEQLVGWG